MKTDIPRCPKHNASLDGAGKCHICGSKDAPASTPAPTATVNVELLRACKAAEAEMSDVVRRGLVDTLAPKSEASSFTQAITLAREAIARAESQIAGLDQRICDFLDNYLPPSPTRLPSDAEVNEWMSGKIYTDAAKIGVWSCIMWLRSRQPAEQGAK